MGEKKLRILKLNFSCQKVKDCCFLKIDHWKTFFKVISDTFLWGSGLGVILNGPGSISFTREMAFPLNHRHRSKDTFYYLKITARPF